MQQNQDVLNIRCETCFNTFPFKGNSILRRSEEDPDIEETGFKCPFCKEETIAIRTNSRLRDLQERVQKERHKSNAKIVRGVPVSKAQRRLRQLTRQLHTELDEFNGRTPVLH